MCRTLRGKWFLVSAIAALTVGAAAWAEEMRRAEAPVELARQILADEHAETTWKQVGLGPVPSAEELAKSLSVREGDLTGDGDKGYLVEAPHVSGQCGSGGCALWVYLRSPHGRLSHFLTGSVYVPESVEIKPMLRTQARR